MADTIENDPRFEWIPFYREYAEKLLPLSNEVNSWILCEILHLTGEEEFANHISKDINNYNLFISLTILSIYRDDMKKRKALAIIKDYYRILNANPYNVKGIPLILNSSSFYEKSQSKTSYSLNGSYLKILRILLQREALKIIDHDNLRSEFKYCMDNVIDRWGITTCFHLVRPYEYPSFDEKVNNLLSSRSAYFKHHLEDKPYNMNSYKTYLDLTNELKISIEKHEFEFSSFPELSYLACNGSLDRYLVKSKQIEIPVTEGLITESSSRNILSNIINKMNNTNATTQSADVKNDASVSNIESPQKINNPKAMTPPPVIVQIINKYEKKDFYKNVIFKKEKDDKSLNSLVALLESKKNIIIQGPPGTGKTHLAKHLAWYINGSDDRSMVEAVQFHQSYSYEDFMLGNRFIDGKCQLIAGPFLNFCMKARMNNLKKHFFIIDEINRGNLSKIFGEALSLIEASKRDPIHGLRLMYPVENIVNDDDGLNDAYNKLKSEKLFYIPENLYIIGTMNTADKSLAFLDFALRRRFAFYEMKPMFGKKEFNERLRKFPKLKALADIVENSLNPLIESTKDEGFLVGHSYFLPSGSDVDEDECIKHILFHELIPLINEYWIDDDTEKNKALGFFDKYTKTEAKAK